MTTKVLKYKGYQGSIEANVDSGRLEGKVLHIKSLITYVGDTLPELITSFRQELDEYISDCEDFGVEPEKPYSGTFQVRCEPDVHRKLAYKASEQGVSFNQYVVEVLRQSIDSSSVEHRALSHSVMARITDQIVSSYSVLAKDQALELFQSAIKDRHSGLGIRKAARKTETFYFNYPRNTEDESIEFSS